MHAGTTGDGIVVLDSDGRVVWHNEAARRQVGARLGAHLPEPLNGLRPDNDTVVVEAGTVAYLEPAGGGAVVRVVDLHEARNRQVPDVMFAMLEERQRELDSVRAELRDTVVRMVDVAQQGRRAAAVVLHDTALQSMIGAGMLLQHLRDTADGDSGELAAMAYRYVADSVEQTRRLVSDLTDDVLTEHGLRVAVARECETLQRTGVTVVFDDTIGDRRSEPWQEALALRTVQEALRNVTKHAGAHSVHVGVGLTDDGTVELWVVDDGVGISVDGIVRGGEQGRFGVVSMRATVTAVDGTFHIRNGPDGAGTEVRCTIPASH